MKKLVVFLVLFFSFPFIAGNVPLEHFAEKSQFTDFKISPDAKHIAFTYEKESEVHLGVMRLKDKKVVTSFSPDGKNREIVQFHWATNDRLIMLNGKITGWLDGQSKEYRLVAGNIDGSKRYELTDFSRSNVNIISMLPDDKKHILVGKYHWSERGGMKLNRMNIFDGGFKYITGSPQPFGTSKSRIRNIAVDTNNVARAAIEFDPVDENNDEDNRSYIHYKHDDEWKVLSLDTQRDSIPTVNMLGFDKSNSKFYFLSNHDLSTDGTVGLFELDLKTEEIRFHFRHPDVDLLSGIRGSNGELIGVYYEPGYPEYHYIDNAANTDEVKFHRSLRASFKNENIIISSYDSDGRMATVRVHSDKNPGDFYIFDRETLQAKYVGSSMPNIDKKLMAAVEPFAINARDGLKMYGQMTVPTGVKQSMLPTVIFPHGGPYGVQDRWRWDRRAQMLANNGYLVIQLNFRGSGGYGKAFYEQGKTQWGAMMQDDLTDVTKWAIKSGYTDPERVCIHGVSYGGYAAMQAVVKEPDLYQCSIPDAGPYELRLQWDEADSFRYDKAAGERYLNWMLGSNSAERIKERSPAYHVDKMQAALLIVHGTEDVRVPIDNAYFLEKKLKEANKPYQTMYKKDGHGFQKVEYRVELYEKMLEFLDEHIGE